MNLKPWREIAQPHKDVLEGSFKQSEFAADISLVSEGKATVEYQIAENFFARTYITEGMRLLLSTVAQRLLGTGGDPVVQLQTAFGGGKTHTLLAVYHLASNNSDIKKLKGIPELLNDIGVESLPKSKVAVVDGIRLSPSQPRKYGNLTVNTIWGELAVQLLGESGYKMISESDAKGTSPGKDLLIQLISKASPCVILIDELVAFVRQLELGKQYLAGTFDSNISFIQALTEAVKSVPNAILLASLPESELEAGGTMGLRTLTSLEKYFARIESIWKPVATEEAFEIVRRRLFDTPGEKKEVEQISRQFCEYYRSNSSKFPTETQSNEYFERMCSSYPIHPEIFDRLYEDWSTLEKFQRTRGVLQYMATVIHRLWNSDNRDALIMPGSLPLEDSNVRNKSIHYLPQGWEPVVEREIDGTYSTPYEIDGKDTRFGGIQAARRAARTIFLGSAPSTREQGIRGITIQRILLGSIQPGQKIGIYEDVLKRLRDQLHYLYTDNERFWLDTKPNLRREMESRKQNTSTRESLQPLVKDYLSKSMSREHHFGGIHIFTPSVDIPDDFSSGPRLVVLSMDEAHSLTKNNQAFSAAEDILRNRGNQPRQKQNRLIFLAADFDAVSRLREQGRTYLAWKSIISDIESGSLNQDIASLNQAKCHLESSEKSLKQLIRETFKWIITPVEDFVKGQPTLNWEAVVISPAAISLVQAIEKKLNEEEWLISTWSPIHLRNLLNQWYFKDGKKEVNVFKIWQDTCSYLYMPRLLNESVFMDSIAQGIKTTDFFAFASGQEGEKYLGFSFGNDSLVTLDDSSLLIERDTAEQYTLKHMSKGGITPDNKSFHPGSVPTNVHESGSNDESIHEDEGSISDLKAQSGQRSHFYGNVSLDPIKAKMDFSKIMDEIVQHFTTKLGVSVKVTIDIEAHKEDGFDENLQRAIKENCNVLKFEAAEFD